jgi:hypothetical protein
MTDDQPWWWPTVIDNAHLARLREDYPEKADLSDEALLEYFDEGKEIGGFSTTWDHVGDAYEHRIASAVFWLTG